MKDESSLPKVGSKKMEIEAVRDFNRDGRADILWRHQAKGSNTLWQVNGDAKPTKQSISRLPAPRWVIVP